MERVYSFEEGEAKSALRFYYGTAKNEGQSSSQGRPVFDKVLFVEVLTPGSKESVPVFQLIRWINLGEGEEPRERRDERRCEKYSRQLRAFLEDAEDPDLFGTPIEAWPGIDVEMVATCKACKIFTVEGLASLSDGKLDVLGMGGRQLRERAQAFLDQARGNAGIEKYAAENVTLKEENKRLLAKIKEQDAKIEALAKEAKVKV